MTASLSFICDAHIPPSLAAWLRQRGHDAIALLELDLEQLSDREICEMARERDAIVVTKDSDFLLSATSARRPAFIMDPHRQLSKARSGQGFREAFRKNRHTIHDRRPTRRIALT
jgi:predicted nuclease of predicted toxin-antitoxin system